MQFTLQFQNNFCAHKNDFIRLYFVVSICSVRRQRFMSFEIDFADNFTPKTDVKRFLIELKTNAKGCESRQKKHQNDSCRPNKHIREEVGFQLLPFSAESYNKYIYQLIVILSHPECENIVITRSQMVLSLFDYCVICKYFKSIQLNLTDWIE